MHRFIPALLLAAVLIPNPVHAQEWTLRSMEPGITATNEPRSIGRLAGVDAARASAATTPFTPLHVTDYLSDLPESREAVEEFIARKTDNLLPVAHKTTESVGTTKDFRVYNFQKSQQDGQTRYDQVNCTLMVTEARFNIWVQTTELGTNVSEADVERLRAHLADSTPPGSFNPQAGIIVNDEVVFGTPPNVDGDGKTDILFLDIQDGYDPPTKKDAITGFVYPGDLGGSVKKDILYLDTYPTLRFSEEEILVTAAHEYQHLIMLNYDPAETAFVNEGLSEWASTMNGYAPRSVNYVSKLDLQRNKLITWPAQIGTTDDYQRAGLFTTYLAERLGVLATGEITRSRYQGASSYSIVLSAYGFKLKDIVASFHAANVVNDTRLGELYGYSTPGYGDVRAAVRTSIDGSTTTSITQQVQGPLAQGGVDYYEITNLGDLSVTISAPEFTTNPAALEAQIRPTVFLYRPDGTVEANALILNGSSFRFTGPFDRVVIAVTHADVVNTTAFLNYEFGATWTQVAETTRQEDVVYDNGRIFSAASGAIEAFYFGPNVGGSFQDDSRAASRFAVPAGGWLSSVSVAPLYAEPGATSFSSVPPTGAVDYVINVWADDGTGRPGETPLFSYTRNDGRSQLFGIQGQNVLLMFDTVDLRPYKDQLSNLPPEVFISFENVGTDSNYLVVPLSEYDPNSPLESPSLFYLHLEGGVVEWRTFPSLRRSTTGESLGNRVLPIRATFTVPLSTDAETAPDHPVDIRLEANYPNPFNPATRIAFALDTPRNARLSVFDVLGREVRVLVDGWTAAGRQEVLFEAGDLASGLYLYRLQAGTSVINRSMLLIR